MQPHRPSAHTVSVNQQPTKPNYLYRSIQQSLVGLTLIGSATVYAQSFPSDGLIELSELNTSQANAASGLAINGITEGDLSGVSVSSAGDINDDGIDDLLIGAFRANPNGDDSGQSYVVFGQSGAGLPSIIELSTLNANGANATPGLIINGIADTDFSSRSVSSAGDMNGDGIDDLLIGAFNADPNGENSGQSYVVFGQSNIGLLGVIELSALNSSGAGATAGLTINGISIGDLSGYSVSRAGDINDDGIDDLLIGASNASPNGNISGQSYVVFGQSDGDLPGVIELSALNASGAGAAPGLIINGIAGGDLSGRSVSSAGDINGDSIDDLLIGAFRVNPNGDDSGQSYVVFGQSGAGLPGVIELSALNTSSAGAIAGLTINGIVDNDRSGRSVSSAGDINGDGIDDLLIGASRASPNSIDRSGQSYVVFGQSNGALPSVIELSALNASGTGATPGLTINGIAAGDYSGRSVSSAGDINGDGIDDLLIGAFRANPNGDDSGQSYVVFGQSGAGLPNMIDLSALNASGTNAIPGLTINGINADDNSGFSVSSAGDINDDGIDDLLIGANGTDPNGIVNSGQSHVIFGVQTRVGLNGGICQFETIADAVSAAQNGDVLFIEAGIYNERIGEISGKDLTLQSAQPGSNCGLEEPFPGQRVVVDGTGFTGFDGVGGILDIVNSSISLRQIDFTNGTTGQGGLVFANPGSSLLVLGSAFSNGIANADLVGSPNPASTDEAGGGCIFAEQASVTLMVTDFINCQVVGPTDKPATGDGGAIHARNNSTVRVGISAIFSGNTARNGGAIFADNSDLIIDRNLFDSGVDDETAVITFENNQADNGGAIHAMGSGTEVLLNQLVFTDNSASNIGGAVHLITSAQADIIDNNFINNSADASGGAISIESDASATIQSSPQCRAFEFTNPNQYCSQFISNQAQFASALNFSFGSSANISNTGFFVNIGGNTIQAFDDAAGAGGGPSLMVENVLFAENIGNVLLLEQGSSTVIAHTTFDTNIDDAIIANGDAELSISNSILAGNQSGVVFNSSGPLNFSCNLDQSDVVGPNTDPQLIETADGFSHLSATSPAVDACQQATDLATDLDGFPRLIGPAYDMGAFEFGILFIDGFE